MTVPSQRLAALRRVPIFRRLEKGTLFEIARRVDEARFPAGATLVREGDPGDALCIVVEGTVEVSIGGDVVAELAAGDFFGEMSLIDGLPRSATVVAVGEVLLYTLSSSDFDSLLNIPYVARAALESLTARLRDARISPHH